MSLERQSHNTNNPWWGEHIYRYQEVANFLENKSFKILDIACGNGFGSFFLSSKGHNVVGGDISDEAILECKKKYNAVSLNFEKVDGTNLPYLDSEFDVVVSFETIEHTKDCVKMLSEFKRVVKKGGFIIVSTPNFLVNSPNGIIVNPYHTQEWTYEDLSLLLKGVFSDVKLYGQEYIRYKKNSLKFMIAKFIETVLYKKGIRKIPISIQDIIMNFMINQPMYPQLFNYSLTQELSEIKKCKTFFAICKP